MAKGQQRSTKEVKKPKKEKPKAAAASTNPFGSTAGKPAGAKDGGKKK